MVWVVAHRVNCASDIVWRNRPELGRILRDERTKL
jgi:hypothetical protein